MIVLIAGASHTGKTLLAQKLLNRYHFPYLSIDLLKMGLIRSGYTHLMPYDDDALEAYLWPVVREMIRTAIENRQDLIVEGCYIPFGWRADFSEEEAHHIRHYCLVMSPAYIRQNFAQILRHANIIEQRVDDSNCTPDSLLHDNARNLALCRQYGCTVIWIDDTYQVDLEL